LQKKQKRLELQDFALLRQQGVCNCPDFSSTVKEGPFLHYRPSLVAIPPAPASGYCAKD
jgi:hypothetical protein